VFLSRSGVKFVKFSPKFVVELPGCYPSHAKIRIAGEIPANFVVKACISLLGQVWDITTEIAKNAEFFDFSL
jgi:hypothetical protein